MKAGERTHELGVHARRGHGEPAPRRVTVALDAKAFPDAAIALARLIARALGASLHGLFPWSTPMTACDAARLMRTEPTALEGIVLDVAVGDPADLWAQTARAEENAFVVLTAEPVETTVDPLGLGEKAARALLEATPGVIVVRPGTRAPRALRRMLRPLDGTPSTAAAIGPVGELAADAGAALDILVVGEVGALHGRAPVREPGAMAPPRYVDQAHHEWAAFSHEFLQRFLGAIGHCPSDVQTRLFLAAGDPAHEICRVARELEEDLIVLVWHGQLEGEHAEVFRRVMRTATCPVLVLKR